MEAGITHSPFPNPPIFYLLDSPHQPIPDIYIVRYFKYSLLPVWELSSSWPGLQVSLSRLNGLYDQPMEWGDLGLTAEPQKDPRTRSRHCFRIGRLLTIIGIFIVMRSQSGISR